MDIYSNHRISFNAGVWARGHKFNKTAVAMTNKLQLIARLQSDILAIERQLEEEEHNLSELVRQAEEKQREQDGN